MLGNENKTCFYSEDYVLEDNELTKKKEEKISSNKQILRIVITYAKKEFSIKGTLMQI